MCIIYDFLLFVRRQCAKVFDCIAGLFRCNRQTERNIRDIFVVINRKNHLRLNVRLVFTVLQNLCSKILKIFTCSDDVNKP